MIPKEKKLPQYSTKFISKPKISKQELECNLPEALLAIEYIGDASTIGIICLTRGPNCKVLSPVLPLHRSLDYHARARTNKIHTGTVSANLYTTSNSSGWWSINNKQKHESLNRTLPIILVDPKKISLINITLLLILYQKSFFL